MKRPKFSLDEKRNFASGMRAKPTHAEAAMWALLRANQAGATFRRQITLYGWIVDFYCPTLRLVIEVDGSAHDSEEAQLRDAQKESVLAKHGLKVIRFENEDVLKYPTVVHARIVQECVRAGLKAFDLESRKEASSRNRCSQNQPTTSAKTNADIAIGAEEKVAVVGGNPVPLVEIEALEKKITQLSRRRSMQFCAPDDRPNAERAQDAQYRLAEYLERRRRQA